MILHFKQTMFLEARDGSFVDERQCIEHPRLKHLQQRDCRSDQDYVVTTFSVAGVQAEFGSIEQTLEALRVTQPPGEIVAC